MNISSILKLTKNLILVGISFISTAYICYAENSAQDLGGISANKIREINLLKADQNRELREANSIADNSFGGVVQSWNKSNSLRVPQISVIGQSEKLSESEKPDNALNTLSKTEPIQESFNGQNEVNQRLEQYEELKKSVKQNGVNYSELSELQLREVNQEMLNLRQLGSTLQEVPDKYFSSGRPDVKKELDEVAASIDERARARFNSLKGTKDADFLQKLRSADQKKDEVDSNLQDVKRSEIETSEENSEVDSEGDKSNSTDMDKELTDIELIRSKCSGSVGSKNGAALVKHLTSGDCGKAINENPELKAEFNIKKIIELISAWGFKTASFSSATNIKLGINKLPELGIIFDLNDVRADFKPIAYQPAVEVQQSQKLVTEENSTDGPLVELMPKDKRVLRHSIRD